MSFYIFSGRLDNSANELSVLKNSMTKLELDNSNIVNEGEEQMRLEKEKYEQKYRLVAQNGILRKRW